MEDLHVSQMTLGDSWDEESFAGESVSDEQERQQDHKKEKLRHTCDCIYGALAISSSPVDEAKETAGPLPLPPAFCFDKAPSRPRRSFDAGQKANALLRSQSDISGHDRFQLSRSEHISRSFRSPKLPSRPAGTSVDETSAKSHPALDESQSSSRDVRIQPPSRQHSGEIKPVIRRNYSRRGSVGDITLRASAHRVLRGSRELSTSEHLKRSCPPSRSFGCK